MGLTGTQFVMLAKGINNSAAYVMVKILPFITLWFGFAIFYKIVPNVQVRLYPAVIGGIVGGTLWQVNNNLSFIYVSKAVQMHSFFGSMAVIPIMLAALYLAWLIVLFGAHVAFAVQNIDLFRSRRLAADITPSYKQKIALACILMINDYFEKGKNPPSREVLSAQIGVPDTFVEEVIPFLLRAGLIRGGNENDTTYLPAMPPEKIHISEILESITGSTHQDIFIKPDCAYWKKAEATCASYHNSHSQDSNPPLIKLL
jgi:membrane protein